MAGEKQVNININYKVNTVEVEKAQQLVQRAQASTNQFQQASQQAGKATETAFKAAGQSIETLNARLLSLKDRIIKSSDPKVVARLSEQYKILEKQVKSANDAAFQTPKALNETGKATQSLAGQLGGLYTAVKLAFTAGIIKEVVTTTLELAKLSGNVEGVERAFNRSFANSTDLLQRLKAVTHGTVTEFELMQRTLQATNLGVAVEQLPILFEFAAARAQQTGESVDYLVDSIVRGIGRKSILVLDNLGLSATRLREQFNGASLASQSVAAVTRGVAEIAKVELEKMGGYAETAATKVDQLTATLGELRVEVAKKVESSWFLDFINQSAQGLKRLVMGSEDAFKEQAKLLGAQDAARILDSNAYKELGDNQQKKIDFLQQEANSRVQLIGRYNDTIKALKEERTEISNKNPYDERIEQITRTIKGYSDNKVVIAATILALKSYVTELGKVNTKEEEQLGIIERLQVEIEAVGEKIKKSSSVEDIERLNRELVNLEFRLRELNELGKTMTNPLASMSFDIKNKLATGQVGLYLEDLVDTQTLEEDTERLFKEIGDKANKKFIEGLTSKTNRTTLGDAFLAAQSELVTSGIDITANALNDLAQMEVDNYDIRLRNLALYYDEQLFLAGDNEKEKDRIRLEEKKKTDKLRREEAKKEQQARLYSILINTAAGIAKAFATSATIYDAYVNAAIVAVEGAAQYAVASKSPRGFAKGVLNLNGKGTGTSDSIPANLSKGESVMTAKEWQTSKNVLKEVRAKKLDDKVLSDLKLGKEGVTYTGGFNDKNILSKLDEVKNAFPDVEERAGLIYTSKVKSKNYRLMVRKSSMSS